MTIKDELKSLILNHFDIKELNPLISDLELTMQNIENWNSLNHVLLFIELEKKFSIRFEAEDLVTLNSFTGIYEFIKDRDDNFK